MRTIPFGPDKVQVSAVAVGCMRISSLSENEADRFVKEALEMGVNYFDHADIYGAGSCEELFGKVLKANPGMREKLFLQSKAGIVPGVMYDNSKQYLLQAVDRILLRLNTDYLDTFLIHRPDALADPCETADALDTLVESGKVRYVGVSNQRSGQMMLLSRYLKNRLAADQLQLSLTNATMIQSGMEANMLTDGAVDRDGQVLDYCRLEGITIQTWSPFQHGFIAGTFLGNPEFPGLNQVLKELAEKYETSDTAIAAAWILNHPAKMQLIAGSTKIQRLREICGAAELKLEKKEWYQLYLAAGHMLP